MINSNRNLPPTQVLIWGFALGIFVGSFLLSLPVATREGAIPYIDALFTAASAVCVTGLVVVDTGTTYTVFGQLVIMILIMFGSLGFMTMATLVFVLLGKQITLKERLIIQEAFNIDSIQGVVRLTLAVVKLAVLFQLAGSFLLSFRFIPLLGWRQGILSSIFHSVSAFGNAGFDIMGNFQSLTGFTEDPLVSLTIAFLFITGGLGFMVVLDLYQKMGLKKIQFHTRVVLLTSLFFLISGFVIIFMLELANENTLAPLSWPGKVMAAFFTAATPRTAGFNVVPTDLLTTPTLVFLLVLMFIGASPASTGGGIKTTTIFIIFMRTGSILRGKEDVSVFRRTIAHAFVIKAMAVFFLAVTWVFLSIFLLAFTENQDFLPIVFEAVSAFGTVGLSMGITPELSLPGKIIIILSMFIGRLGPLTVVFALAKKQKSSSAHYPEGKILIG